MVSSGRLQCACRQTGKLLQTVALWLACTGQAPLPWMRRDGREVAGEEGVGEGRRL
jgi:hypothetical protein